MLPVIGLPCPRDDRWKPRSLAGKPEFAARTIE